MSDLTLVITNAGRTALVNAAHTGTAPITITHCGVSATAITPHPDISAIPAEIKRISAIAGEAVSDSVIHLTVRDETAAVYTMRSFGLYTDDGTLFAVYGQSAPIMEKSAGAMLLLAIDAEFTDVEAAEINFGDTDFLMPPATETRQGVIELATQVEANAGSDDLRAVTPKKGKAALLPWLLAQDGAGSGIDADLLDGKQASAFLELVNFTGAAVLAKLLTADGAGSGLDADALDGQQGSYYTNIPARLGFTPLNSAAFTAAAVLSRLLTVDGAGSGIDADLLDGQQGSYYTNIIARLGFTPLNAANYTAADVLAKMLTQDGAGSGLDADLLDGKHASAFLELVNFTGAAVLAKLLTVDGAGSGIDADLLDGQQGSYYTNIPARLGFTPLNAAAYTAADVLAKMLTQDGAGSGLDADLLDGKQLSEILPTQSFGTAGWCRLPNGMIFQWGRISASANAYATITFPIAFPQMCCHAHSAIATEVGNSDAQANGPMVYAVTTTAASVYNAAPSANAFWLAIGY